MKTTDDQAITSSGEVFIRLKCQDTLDMPKYHRFEFRKVRSVLGSKCPWSKVSVHRLFVSY